MRATQNGISPGLQKAYADQYSDRMTEWRDMGAKYKALNIVKVSRGHVFQKVLECGAGEGSIIKYLDLNKFASEMFAIEISDSAIAQIRKRNIGALKEVKKFDGYNIPYKDGEFDLAYCSHVIEHVEHPRLLLRELRRVSKFQIFEVPIDYSPNVDTNTEHFLSYGHINIYTPALFRFLLKSEGFRIHQELATDIPREVLEFIAYRKNGPTKRPFLQRMKFLAYPLLKIVKGRLIKMWFRGEYGYSAFTCLTSGEGRLQIFNTPLNQP